MSGSYTKRKYEYLPYETLRGLCTTYDDFRHTEVYHKTVSKNPVDHRAYPVNPLDSPTAQPLQSTLVARTQREKIVELPVHEVCGGQVLLNNVERVRYAYTLRHIMVGTPPSTNWQLDMRNKIKAISVNLGVTLAEYRKTQDMFEQFGLGVYGAWRAFRGKYKRKTSLNVCHIAAAELITSYGLEPLIGDLFDSAMRLQNKLDENMVHRVMVTKKSQESFSDESPAGLAKTRSLWTRSDRAIAYVKLDANNANFTLGNPAEIAWELVPFSFVIDWGIPIGDYLSSLDALSSVTAISGTLTTKTTCYGVGVGPINDGFDVTKQGFSSYKSHERQVLTSIPMSELPEWSPSMGLRRMTHALSLLTSLSSTCRKTRAAGT